MTLFSHRSDTIQTTFWPRQDSGATCNHEDSVGSNLGDKLEIPQAHLSFSVQCLSEAVGLQPFNSSASNAVLEDIAHDRLPVFLPQPIWHAEPCVITL